MAVILAGGEGERLSILSQERAKPAVPFGGKYRIIDFTLSNCVNSEIDNVVVLTQYNPRSLNDHIGLGRPWDLDRNTGGVRMLQAFAGPFPRVTFCPTGGITAANYLEYLALGNVACVGGSWVAPQGAIEAGDWARVTALARKAVAESGR